MGGMGSVLVVVLLPGCDLGAGVGQCREQHLVQKADVEHHRQTDDLRARLEVAEWWNIWTCSEASCGPWSPQDKFL
jgi:hypothetical protein